MVVSESEVDSECDSAIFLKKRKERVVLLSFRVHLKNIKLSR